MVLGQFDLLLEAQVVLQEQLQVVLLVRKIDGKRVLFRQQLLQDLTTLHSPHALLLQLLVLLPQHADPVASLASLLTQQF